MAARVIPLCGALTAAGLLFMLLSLLGVPLPPSVAGLCYWAAALLAWPRLVVRNRWQSLLLIGVGCAGLGWRGWHGGEIPWLSMLTGSSVLLSMLVAVTFLSLIGLPATTQATLPGRRGIVSTLLGVHLFGAVINLSALFIIGDRIAQKSATGVATSGSPLQLERRQAIALSRGFSVAAIWSPFFAAMAVALTYAPDMQLLTLWGAGMPLAVLALAMTYRELALMPAEPPFAGYPIRYSSLWLPALLAVLVLVIHDQWPALVVPAIITLLSPLLALLSMARHPRRGGRRLQGHLFERLPQMGNELLLFQSAAILSLGVSAVIDGLEGWQLFDQFGALQAYLCLLVGVGLAVLGIHPLISIVLLHSLLSPLLPDQTLVALLYLLIWALGSSVGPLSGMNLSIQGRYGIDGYAMMRWNLGYLGRMLLLSALPIAWLAA